ncbi:MAG: hypothetical protein NTY19_46670 [Planctomycetota bacterium]|nr:hypothetical protein [Planctomycetota bacterium]
MLRFQITGEELWTCDGPSESASSMIALGRDLIYSSVGFPRRNMLCIRANGLGDVTKTHVVWSKKDKMAYVPSLVLAEGLTAEARAERLTPIRNFDGGFLELPGKPA